MMVQETYDCCIQLLADITPGDLNTFLFPSGGAEATEMAIRMARVMTKRHKVGVHGQ